MEKDLSLKSRTEKCVVEAGVEDKTVFGFVTMGCKGTTAVLMDAEFWTKWKAPEGFLDGENGCVMRGVCRT